MRAGLLNYPITIQEPVTVKDVYGANGIDWRDIISPERRLHIILETDRTRIMK